MSRPYKNTPQSVLEKEYNSNCWIDLPGPKKIAAEMWKELCIREDEVSRPLNVPTEHVGFAHGLRQRFIEDAIVYDVYRILGSSRMYVNAPGGEFYGSREELEKVWRMDDAK